MSKMKDYAIDQMNKERDLSLSRTHIPILRPVKRQKAQKRLRKVSKGHAAELRQYTFLRKEFLKRHPYCQWHIREYGVNEGNVILFGGLGDIFIPPSVDIHHTKGRGKYLLDTSTWMAVSRKGHLMIHNDPKYSYEKGYMVSRN